MLILDFISGVLISIIILFFRYTFYNLALKTTTLLDIVFDKNLAEKDKFFKLVINFKSTIKSLLYFIIYLSLIVFSFYVPYLIYGFIYSTSFEINIFSKFYNLIIFSLGTCIPFILFNFLTPKTSYSELSQVFHKIILDNYNIGKKVFDFQIKDINKVKKKFVVVSGLARCGTTALTTILNKSNQFKSLNYSNMPFILAPNIWSKIYKVNSDKNWERKHGDQTFINYSSAEALDEYFFKVFFNDCYISEKKLLLHKVPEDVHTNYLKFHKSFCDEEIYLTKNNNFILRYNSFRSINNKFNVIFMFREPLRHSFSLLRQHKKFSTFQKEDPFILTYMNWLGHHEFGINEKRMNLDFDLVEKNKNHLNYWLEVWINYYQFLLKIFDKKDIIIDYDDFLNNPKKSINLISDNINLELSDIEIIKFNKKEVDIEGADVDIILKSKAKRIYKKLLLLKSN